MMRDLIIYQNTPIGSLLLQEPSEEEKYLYVIPRLPPQLFSMVVSPKTGAFIRGLAAIHDIASTLSPAIAFAVLQVMTGDKPLAQLAHTISTALNIPTDIAEKIAIEIEKELFAPIALEFNQYLKSKQQSPAPSALPSSNLPNVLDLKNQPPKPPLPPPIPR